MKRVIPTPYIAKFFHPIPNIEGKKCLTSDIQDLPRHSTPNQVYTETVFFKSTPETVKYFILTLDTDPPPFQGP